MRDKARRGPAALVLLLSLLMVVAALPAAAAAPQPVIAVDGPADSSGDSGDGTDPGDAAGEDGGVGDDQAPPDEEAAGCLLGPSAAAATLASYPGPVIAVPPLPSPCRTRISLSLVVESPDERRPQGADAVVAGQTVPRAALEAGFSTTLPASSRTISLTDPGQDWEDHGGQLQLRRRYGDDAAGELSAAGDRAPDVRSRRAPRLQWLWPRRRVGRVAGRGTVHGAERPSRRRADHVSGTDRSRCRAGTRRRRRPSRRSRPARPATSHGT